ncbi:hypothetical protein Sjap_019471 [Stephania japonica]|uniref:Uncharacterized protein n=1 Tax=Stephania japonica TaxID=461633 RepID=A0AAP0F1P1_9MAGN
MALLVEKTSSGERVQGEGPLTRPTSAPRDRARRGRDARIDGLPCTEFSPSRPVRGCQDHRVPPHDDPDRRPHRDPYRPSAEVRRCSRNIFSTQNHATAAIARDSRRRLRLEGRNSPESRWCTERRSAGGPEGAEEFAKSGKVPNPNSTDNAEFQIVLTIIRDGLKSDPKKYHKMKERLV